MSTMPRFIPDAECAQGRCGNHTTGCQDVCWARNPGFVYANPTPITLQLTLTEARIREIAITAAKAVAKNTGAAEQLCFPHIYLTLKDELGARS